MELGSLFQQAATLMLTGMSVVFVFLTILIFLVHFMSRFVPEERPPELVNSPTLPASGQIPAETVAAISAAVHKYRNRQS